MKNSKANLEEYEEFKKGTKADILLNTHIVVDLANRIKSTDNYMHRYIPYNNFVQM